MARYEAALLDLTPRLERVEAPAHRIADDAHLWGPSPFHYVGSYYGEIARQLRAKGIEIRARQA